MNLLDVIQQTAKREGISLIGFAGWERFANVPAELNPFSIFPEAKTVIMLGKRICRGSLRGIEEGTNFGDYSFFGQCWLEDEFLALACYNLVSVIEDEGWEAVPIFPNPTGQEPSGIPVAPNKPAPNVYPDFDYAAVACGLCEISYSGIPLSKEFGSRQRFHMILTDAELPETPIMTESICDRCGLCAKACPLGAISATKTETVEICGKVMQVAKIDYEICKRCKNGAVPSRFDAKCKPDRIAAVCNRTCLCHLEENAFVENRFENAFRQRDTWRLDSLGRYAESSDAIKATVSKDGNRGACQ